MFQKCGANFAGLFSVKISLRRNASSSTAYVCVWVCFVTKAVHMKLVRNLNMQSFLNALKIFCDRRGVASSHLSDFYLNLATNFFRANCWLSKLKNLFLSSEHQEKLKIGMDNVMTICCNWKIINNGQLG